MCVQDQVDDDASSAVAWGCGCLASTKDVDVGAASLTLLELGWRGESAADEEESRCCQQHDERLNGCLDALVRLEV